MAVMKKHKEPSFVNKGFSGVLVDNYVKRGIQGLFRGLSVTLLGILPYSGIAFALNEQGKREVGLVRDFVWVWSVTMVMLCVDNTIRVMSLCCISCSDLQPSICIWKHQSDGTRGRSGSHDNRANSVWCLCRSRSSDGDISH
jgi:hypothetical protein